MRILESLNVPKNDNDFPVEKILNHKLILEFEKLARFNSSKQLVQSAEFQQLKQPLSELIYGYEYGCYVDESDTARKKPFIRAVLWHLENGINYNGILETLRNRALVRKADIYFFPSTDIGMARSGNRNVIRDLAIELGYNYYFATTFVNLDSSDTNHFGQKTNVLGLEGNAIMTRFPVSNLRYVSLNHYHDIFNGPKKILGCEKVLLADLVIDDNRHLTVVCINLPDYSSPRHRYKYMRQVMGSLKDHQIRKTPILIGGDLKTSTYNCKTELHFFLSVLNKVYRDFDFIAGEHHVFPERFFEKHFFDYLKSRGFYFDILNEMGTGCFNVKPEEIFAAYTKKRDTKLYNLVRSLLKNRNEKLSYKHDWFIGNRFIKPSESHQAERPKVISHLFFDGRPVSSHDPVLLDFEIADVRKD
ncbi:MAG: hypothetical protein HQM16_00365 [Deltaproteobacteria bacterium]|nr:hypothetical protein [Deltaproteobacteria bacterium]